MRNLFKELMEGGFTARWTTFEKPTKRFIVGVTGSQFQFTGLSSEFDKALELFLSEIGQDTIKTTFGFGGWVENDILYLDAVVETDNLDEALEKGFLAGQKCIYDQVDERYYYLPEPQRTGTMTQQATYKRKTAQCLREGRTEFFPLNENSCTVHCYF